MGRLPPITSLTSLFFLPVVLTCVLSNREAKADIELPLRILFCNRADVHYGNLVNGGPDGFSDLRRELIRWDFEVVQLDEPAMTPSLLDSNEIVVLGSNARSYSTQEVADFGDFISHGGRALFLVGYGEDDDFFTSDNLLLSQFGITLGETTPWGQNNISVFSTHPITVGLTKVIALGLNPIASAGPGVQSLAFWNAETVLSALETGTGRIVVYSDWDTFSNISHGDFSLYTDSHLTLAQNIFEWLSSGVVPRKIVPSQVSDWVLYH